MAQTQVLTNVGRGLIATLLAGSALKYIAWGTGTNAPTVGDLALQTEAAQARALGAQTVSTTTVNGDTYRVEGTIMTGGASLVVTEFGLLDQPKAANGTPTGNLAVRAVSSGYPVGASDGLDIIFTIQVQ